MGQVTVAARLKRTSAISVDKESNWAGYGLPVLCCLLPPLPLWAVQLTRSAQQDFMV